MVGLLAAAEFLSAATAFSAFPIFLFSSRPLRLRASARKLALLGLPSPILAPASLKTSRRGGEPPSGVILTEMSE